MTELYKHWKKEKTKDGWERFRFVGTSEQFDEWCKQWYREVPECEDFSCCHELMSCGINFGCGDCSIYPTMQTGCSNICTNVDCLDCNMKYECEFGWMSEEDRNGKKLKFKKKEVGL